MFKLRWTHKSRKAALEQPLKGSDWEGVIHMFIHCHSVHDYPALPPEAAYKWPLKRGGQGVGRAEWPSSWLRHSLTALSRSLFSHLFGVSGGSEREQDEQEQSMASSWKGNWGYDARVNFPWMSKQVPWSKSSKSFFLSVLFQHHLMWHTHIKQLSQ